MRTSQYKVRLRWEKGALRSYATFSWPLFVAGASSMVIAQSSILVGTKALGLAAVGGIALASSISDYTNKVDQIVTQTLYPAICAVKDRTDLLFESFVKSNRLALMWGLPFGVAVALFASDLVTYGIGERWRPAVGIIAAFGLVAALGHIAFNWDAFFRARGETRPIAVWSFVTMLSFVAFAIPLMLWKGLNGFAVGMGIMAFVSLVVRGLYLTKLFDGLQMLRHAARAIAPTVPAVLAVLGVRALVGDGSLARRGGRARALRRGHRRGDVGLRAPAPARGARIPARAERGGAGGGVTRDYRMTPSPSTLATSWARERAPIFVIALRTCVRTVSGEMCNSSAISGPARPCATSRTT